MKIALLHHCLDVSGGAERQLLMLAIGLQEKGHEVIIYVSKLDSEKCYPNLIKKVKVIECGGFGYKDIKKTILFSPYYMYIMARKIQDCDIINCHNYPTNYAAVKIKIKKKTPIVWMCNEMPFPPLYNEEKGIFPHILKTIYKIIVTPYLAYNKITSKLIDHIIVFDRLNCERVRKSYKKKPTILPSGLDFPTSLPANSINEEKDPNHFVILCTGRIDQGKRTEDAIMTLSQLKDKIPNILLKIAGGGSKLEEMKQLAEKMNLKNFVKFYGRVSDRKLQELYSSCDIFLFTAENQSWGLVPLEAMSYGKPCLVSTGAGVADVLTDKEHCLKITPRDVTGIVENILWLYDHPQEAQKIAKNGEKFVRDNFSWEKYVERMENIFKEFQNT